MGKRIRLPVLEQDELSRITGKRVRLPMAPNRYVSGTPGSEPVFQMNMTVPTQTISPPRATRRPAPRATRLEDYGQIQQLEASHGLRTLEERDWRAMWLDNPLRRRLGDHYPFGWVLEDAGRRIVGSLANIPTLYTCQGRDLIAATGRAWVVSSDYRGMALMLMDEYFNQEGVDLLINTTVNSMAVDPFSAFGSVRVPLGDWESAAFWVTCYRGFAAAALRIKSAPLPRLLAYPAGLALRTKDALTLESLPPAADSIAVEQACSFDSRFDDFWRELIGQNPRKLLGVRDGQSLRWHFATPIRQKQAWIFTASRNSLLRAYCILKRQDHPQSGLVRMRLVDFQTLKPDADLLSAMLHPALARCIAERIHVFEHVGMGLPKMRAFDRHAPYRRKLPAWPFYYHAVDPALHEELHDPQVWDPSTFDGDASL